MQFGTIYWIISLLFILLYNQENIVLENISDLCYPHTYKLRSSNYRYGNICFEMGLNNSKNVNTIYYFFYFGYLLVDSNIEYGFLRYFSELLLRYDVFLGDIIYLIIFISRGPLLF